MKINPRVVAPPMCESCLLVCLLLVCTSAWLHVVVVQPGGREDEHPPPGCMLLLCNLVVEKMSTSAWLHVVVVQPRRHHHSAGHHPGDATTLGECTPPRTGSSNDGGVRLLPASLSTKGSSFPGRCCDPLFSEFGGSSIYVCV